MQANYFPRRRTRSARVAAFVAALFVMLAVAGLRPAAPALAACGGTTFVSDTTSLNNAIIAFNAAPSTCVFGIEFTGNITLTAQLLEITNVNPGVELIIDGAGHTLDGDGQTYRGFDIDNVDLVTFQDITISELYDYGIYGIYGDLHVRRSTIQMNGSDGIQWYNGDLLVVDSAMIYNGHDGIEHDVANATLTVINTTLVGNGAKAFSLEGENTTRLITHVTTAGNERTLALTSGTMTVNNSIFADDATCNLDDPPTVDFNFSLLTNAADACGAVDGVDGNIVGQDARLMPLGFYGGPTQTMPPSALDGGPRSPAIDNGSEALSQDEGGATLAYDQRGTGYPRVSGEGVDMGAAETEGAYVCPTFPATVTEADQLAVAILCYNEQTTPGVYKIIVEWDIDLNGSTPTIDNDTGGVSLLITGGGRTLDAQDIVGARPITVAAGSTVEIEDLTLTGGYVPREGGGVLNDGLLTLGNVQVTGNKAGHTGGGIFNGDDATLHLNNIELTFNAAAYPYGSGGGITNNGTVNLSDSVVAANTADGKGGVNTPVRGGGVWNRGTMRVERSTIANNSAVAANGYVYGGGIVNQGGLIIRDSAITDNSVVSDGIYGFSVLGGGIYSGFGPDASDIGGQATQLTVINSTISGNSLRGSIGVLGGGIFARGSLGDCCTVSTVELINITVVNNSLTSDVNFGGGGLLFDVNDQNHLLEATIHNSIVAGNLANGATGHDCLMSYSSWLTFESRNTLYESSGVDGACGLAAANPDASGNIVGVAADLGPLAFNGGPTRTHLPNALSPAINAGDSTLAVDETGQPLAADQRGYTPRVVGGAVDMGAVEVGTEAPFETAVYMSAATSGTTADGLAFDNSDILKWDLVEWTLAFDGSAADLGPNNKPKHNVNAFYVDSCTNGVYGTGIAMSFAQNGRKVPGLPDKVDGMDLVWWDGSTFSLLFDGSDVGLTKKTPEKIDGLHMLDGSDSPIATSECAVYLLISTQGPVAVPAYGGGTLKFGGEDVLGFCATNLGEATAGFWHMVLDGSAVGIKKNAIDSISLSEDGETLALTSKATFNAGGVVGGHSMVFAYDLVSETFSGPHFIAADNGLSQKVDGLQVNGFCWDECG